MTTHTDAVPDPSSAGDGELRPPPLPPLPGRRHEATRRARRLRRTERPGSHLLVPLAGFGLAAAMALYVLGASRSPFPERPTSGVVWLPVVALVAWLLCKRAARDEPGFDLAGIALLGFALRAVAAYLRFIGGVDSIVYHRVGADLADRLRAFELFFDTGREIPGTGWLRYTSAVVHVLTFDDMMGSFLVFTLLAWTGSWLCYRAFAHAFPDGDRRRYALFVFLWPTLVYWPSSIGKEAWMLLGIGIASWGVSRVVTGRTAVGLGVLLLGLLTTGLVRPHVSLMLLLAFAVSLLARPGRRRTGPRVAARVVGVLLLLVGGTFLAGRTAEVLKLDVTGAEGIAAGLEETEAKTTQGEAAFTPATVRDPLDYPVAFVTVWFRPFPQEAHDASALVSALEGAALLGIFALSARRLWRLPGLLRRVPYVTFATTFTLAFVYAFASIGNFGILVRQRSQGLLLLFVLLALPAPAGGAAAPDGAGQDPAAGADADATGRAAHPGRASALRRADRRRTVDA